MHLAIQCTSGASGDMLLGALLDCGADVNVVRDAIAAVTPEPIGLDTEQVRRAGFSSLKADVSISESHHHRGWRDIQALLNDAGPALTPAMRQRAWTAFELLADAEGKAHGVPPADVHFHEVGALDAIADIVGVSAALADLGVEQASCESISVGSGTVHTSHGLLDVPVPAVVELLSAANAPVKPGVVAAELCTPTGAALLAANVTQWGTPPTGRIVAAGAGAGTADHADLPNVVRIQLLEVASAAEELVASAAVIAAANVDDLDPRVWPHVIDALLIAGADDAWLTPIVMKKGRPAHTISALCTAAVLPHVRDALLRETSTIGLRVTPATKHAAPRIEKTVTVHGHPVRIKVAVLGEDITNTQPEFDDVLRVADATDLPLRDVLAAAQRTAAASVTEPGDS